MKSVFLLNFKLTYPSAKSDTLSVFKPFPRHFRQKSSQGTEFVIEKTTIY